MLVFIESSFVARSMQDIVTKHVRIP